MSGIWNALTVSGFIEHASALAVTAIVFYREAL